MPEPEQDTRLANGPVIIELRKAKGYQSRNAFIRAIGKALGPDTIKRCEKSPKEPWWSRLSSFEVIASLLDCEASELYFPLDSNDPHEPLPVPEIADCSGLWDIHGKDIEVDGHFEYPNGPMELKARVVVELNPRTGVLSARGDDHDNDPCSFRGQVREGGRIIIGEYAINNGRSHIYGSLLMRYHNCGNLMSGYYMGRGTGQGSELIFATIKMVRVEEATTD